ncbi:MAG TPA: hypothetical protein VGI93_22760 [Steroidobacteraceae bacterium]
MGARDEIPLKFARHFVLLGLALIVAALFDRFNPSSVPYLPGFAVYGALHALCVVASLDERPALNTALLFVLVAALLNAGVLYTGIGTLALLRQLPSGLQLYVSVSVCALFGAIGYGLWLRHSFAPGLRPRRLVQMALCCVLVVCLVLAAELYTSLLERWLMVGAWWGSFSVGLWLVARRANVFGPQADAK